MPLTCSDLPGVISAVERFLFEVERLPNPLATADLYKARDDLLGVLARQVHRVANAAGEASEGAEAVLDLSSRAALQSLCHKLLSPNGMHFVTHRRDEAAVQIHDCLRVLGNRQSNNLVVYSHGNMAYSVGEGPQGCVSEDEDNLLTIFLEEPRAMVTKDLESLSGVVNVSRAMRKLRERFGAAVQMPGKERKGCGYYINVKHAPAG